MALIAEYELRCPHLPLVDVARALPAVTLSVEVGQPNQGSLPPFFVTVAGEAVGDVRAAFAESSFVDAVALVGHGAETARFQVLPAVTMETQLGPHVDDVEQLRRLAANESIVEAIEVTRAGWIQQRWFADRAAFDEYREFWQRNGEGFSLHRLTLDDGSEDAGDGREDDGLTEPQRDALATAYEMGYFDIPRSASLGEVADELDISTASASERLRRGQAALVESNVAVGAAGRHSLKQPQH